jgi:hypothetical protein
MKNMFFVLVVTFIRHIMKSEIIIRTNCIAGCKNQLDDIQPLTKEQIKKAHAEAVELHKKRIPLFPARFQKARDYGWSIQGKYLTAPSHFQCRHWAAEWESFEDIYVPHWFWIDSVLQTGV